MNLTELKQIALANALTVFDEAEQDAKSYYTASISIVKGDNVFLISYEMDKKVETSTWTAFLKKPDNRIYLIYSGRTVQEAIEAIKAIKDVN